MSDKNGSIVVIQKLEVNSIYEYQVYVYNAKTLIIKPVNGVFKTLNTTIIPGQNHKLIIVTVDLHTIDLTSLVPNSAEHYTNKPIKWTGGTISGLTTESYTNQQTKWIHEGINV